jgi:TusE/DsrC/DsvC family sulfur relay protein
MPDINAYIMHPESSKKSPEALDRELSLNDWNHNRAQLLSDEEGIVMTPEHWEVISFLQNYYLQYGWPLNAHSLSKKLDTAFADKGGARYLYQLFPGGPLAQGGRIAGLPVPHHVKNESFGSVQ